MPKMKLSDIGSLSRGKSKHRPRNDKILYGGKYPFVQTSDIKNANHILHTYEQTYNEIGLKQSKLWGKNTICITIAANIADSAILGFDACFPDSIIGLTVNDKIANYHYVEYLLQYYKRIIQNQSNGTSQENINLETFEQVYFDIPSLNEQNNISNTLYSIDKKIDLNNKINSELEDFAKKLYEYWFIQFDFPDENERPYKSSGGSMIYNDILKRKIPENWINGTLSDISSTQTGYAFKSCDWKENGHPVLTIKVIENNSINMPEASFIENYQEKYAKYSVENGNIILAMTGNTIGKIGIIASDTKNILINQRVCIYKSNYTDIAYLYFNLLSEGIQNKIWQIGQNSSQPNISEEQLKQLPIVLPPNELLNKYNKIFSSSFKRIVNNNIENQLLSKLRDFILPMLMNGQITIK